jgi:hypothetical protein
MAATQETATTPEHTRLEEARTEKAPWKAWGPYYGDRLTVECPTGSGRQMNLLEVAVEISGRLTSTFTEDEQGRRAVFGGLERFQSDPHWHDLLLFHEYFHGDNGAGIGASHQTGWTGSVAVLFPLTEDLRVQPGTIGGVAE